MARCVPGRRGRVHSAASTLQARRLGHRPQAPKPAHQQRPRRDGVGAAATPPDGVGRVGSRLLGTGGRCHSRAWPRAISRGRRKRTATASGAGRRLLATASASAPPRRRRLLPPCGFSHRARGNGHCWLTTRRHKHCSTAAATTAGVAHRSLHCTRDRERCTES